MIGDVATLYPLWLKEARTKAKGDLTRAQQSLDALQTRGIYYDSIKAMRDARQRVYDVLLATPNELGAEPVSPPAGDEANDERMWRAYAIRAGFIDSEWAVIGDASRAQSSYYSYVAALKDMRAATPAAPSPSTAGTAPEGWKLVPVNPTEDMVSKANRTARMDATGAWRLDAITAYSTMLAATPAAPVVEPMTEQQIANSAVEHPHNPYYSAFRAGAKAAEQHHGIKQHTPTPEVAPK